MSPVPNAPAVSTPRTPGLRTSPAAARMRRLIPLALPLGFALLAGCAGDTKKEADSYVERPVEQIYAEATNAVDLGNYTRAAILFSAVEQQHPYSQWAMRAELMAAYSFYEAYKFEEALGALDRFIGLHPGNPSVAYAYYLKGLCYYQQISDVRRDQGPTVQAQKALEEVVRRFPSTPYARDAKLKLDLTRDHLAGREMMVGRFYENTHLYLAGIRRFRTVVDNYPTTSHAPEALHRLVECYMALGMVEEATKAAALLGHNYPGSHWYEASYDLVLKSHPMLQDEKGLLDTLLSGAAPEITDAPVDGTTTGFTPVNTAAPPSSPPSTEAATSGAASPDGAPAAAPAAAPPAAKPAAPAPAPRRPSQPEPEKGLLDDWF